MRNNLNIILFYGFLIIIVFIHPMLVFCGFVGLIVLFEFWL